MSPASITATKSTSKEGSTMSEKIPIGSSYLLTASPNLGKKTAHLMIYTVNAPQ